MSAVRQPLHVELDLKTFVVGFLLICVLGFVVGWWLAGRHLAREQRFEQDCQLRGGAVLRTLDGEEVCMGPERIDT